MGKKTVTYKANEYIAKCPKCSNNTKMTFISAQVAEDCCEVWACCGRCKYDPSEYDSDYRMECVWGDISLEAQPSIIANTWNCAIEEQ